MDDGLAALPPGGSGDGGGHTRPNLTYVGLIREAIVESPEQRLYLREIYEAIADKYPYYRDQTTATWKNVIRHCLSITPAFKNLPKEVNQPGKGGVWTIDDSIPDAYSRRRIRKSEGSRSSTSASASTSSSSKSNRRRRSSASNGSASTPAVSRSLPSENGQLEPLEATTWSLDPPGTVGSGSSGSAHELSRSTPAWLSPASTYSSQPGGGGGGLFDQSPSDRSDASALAPSPYSLPHSMPHTSPPTDGAYSPHAGPFGVGGGLGFGQSYPGQGYSTAPPNATLSLSYPAPSHGPHQAFSAPISPSNFSPTLPTSSSAGYSQQPYPLMAQLQMGGDGQSSYDPRSFSSGGGGSSSGGSSRSPMLQMHVGGGPPSSAASGETTSLGLSISHLQWRQLPAVEEQQPTPAYSWPPVPTSLHSALQHGAGGASLTLGHDPSLADRAPNDAIAPPPRQRQKGTQSSEWDAGLRY